MENKWIEIKGGCGLQYKQLLSFNKIKLPRKKKKQLKRLLEKKTKCFIINIKDWDGMEIVNIP